MRDQSLDCGVPLGHCARAKEWVKTGGVPLEAPKPAIALLNRNVAQRVHVDKRERSQVVHLGWWSGLAPCVVTRHIARMIRAASFFGSVKSCGIVRLIKYAPVGLWHRLACYTRTAACVSRVARVLLLPKPSCSTLTR